MLNVNTELLNKAYKTEYSRWLLAKIKNYSELIKTYGDKKPQIPNENTGLLWDKLNETTNLENIIKVNPMANNRLNIVKKWIVSNHKIKKVLDCGFGSGVLEDKFGEEILKYQWFGTETSKKSLNKAIRKYPNVNFKFAEAKKLTFKDQSFDCVVMLEVLEHIPTSDTLTVLKEINRILKKNGQLIISVPMNEGLETLIKNNKNLNKHVRMYTNDLIKAELTITNFRIIKCINLYAFSKMYIIKKFICKFIKNTWLPNNIIVLAQK